MWQRTHAVCWTLGRVGPAAPGRAPCPAGARGGGWDEAYARHLLTVRTCVFRGPVCGKCCAAAGPCAQNDSPLCMEFPDIQPYVHRTGAPRGFVTSGAATPCLLHCAPPVCIELPGVLSRTCIAPVCTELPVASSPCCGHPCFHFMMHPLVSFRPFWMIESEAQCFGCWCYSSFFLGSPSHTRTQNSGTHTHTKARRAASCTGL